MHTIYVHQSYMVQASWRVVEIVRGEQQQ